MKKTIYFIMAAMLLTGCMLRTHKADVIQGNVIVEAKVKQLHTGMSETEVRNIMGTPVLINVFTPGRTTYLYTFQEGYGSIKKKSVEITLSNGIVRDIQFRPYS